MKEYIYIMVVLSTLFASCDGDTFTTTLNVDPPEYEELMVVNLFATNHTDTVAARVGKTYPVLEDLDYDKTGVSKAELMVRHEGRVILTLSDSGLQNGLYLGELEERLIPGETYELLVDHDTLGMVSATQIMPDSSRLVQARLIEDAGIDLNGDAVSAIEIRLDDPAGVDNYYEFSPALYVESDDRYYGYSGCTEVEDPQIEYGYQGTYLLSDQTFDGKRITLRMLFRPDGFCDFTENSFVAWKSITRDYYQFSASLERNVSSSDFAGFAEPTLVYSNINGGLGCFSLSFLQYIPIEE